MKDIKKMLGKPKNVFPPQKKTISLLGVDAKRPTRDADGDKVVNVMDCEPYNKNRQGFIHNIKARLKESSERRAALREERKEIRDVAFKARVEEEKKVAVERARKRVREGGALTRLAKSFVPPKRSRFRRIKRKKKGKTRTILVSNGEEREPQRKMPNLEDFKIPGL